MKKSQTGFSVLLGLLIIVMVGLVSATGWYVWNSAHQTDKGSDNSIKAAQTATPAKTPQNSISAPNVSPPQKYISIKEWGIRIPYSGDDTYSYQVSQTKPETVNIISEDLADQYSCTSSGAGQIVKRKPTDAPGFNYLSSEMESTVAQDAATHPTRYVHLGSYYYAYLRDATACSSAITRSPSGLAAQNAANQYVLGLMSKVEPIPN